MQAVGRPELSSLRPLCNSTCSAKTNPSPLLQPTHTHAHRHCRKLNQQPTRLHLLLLAACRVLSFLHHRSKQLHLLIPLPHPDHTIQQPLHAHFPPPVFPTPPASACCRRCLCLVLASAPCRAGLCPSCPSAPLHHHVGRFLLLHYSLGLVRHPPPSIDQLQEQGNADPRVQKPPATRNSAIDGFWAGGVPSAAERLSGGPG